MQIEIKIDPSCTEPKIIVVAESMSEEVQNLVKRLSVDVSQVISGIRDERLEVLEERLDRQKFVRISNSEIVNLKKVKAFDLSFAGTVCVEFMDGTVTYVSRRYVPKIKRILGI